mgnify:CR=1 FL=1
MAKSKANRETHVLTSKELVQQRLARLDRAERRGSTIKETPMLAAFMKAVTIAVYSK